ncbi:MAG: SH3 domain-containing protein [Thermoflexales bacterium]|nr:SH3 domain-containing protein [Thermoflexales bacterium]
MPFADQVVTETLVIIGETNLTPPDRTLRYRLRDSRGTVWLEGTQRLNGESGDPSTFSVTLTLPDALVGPVQIELSTTLALTAVPLRRAPRIAAPLPGLQLQLSGVARVAVGQVRPPLLPSRSWLPLYGLPRHIWIGLDEAEAAPAFTPYQRQLIIVPVPAYRELFGGEDTAMFDAAIQALNAAIRDRSDERSRALDVLPVSGYVDTMRASVSYLSAPAAEGVRWVTMFTQDIRSVAPYSLTYVYQGLTRDARYFIAAFIPVTNTALPLTPTVLMREAIRADYSAYLRQVEAVLEANVDAFTPPLESLDAMIASLRLDAELVLSDPQVAIVSATDWLNVRAGPGTNHRVITRLAPEQQAEALALSPRGDWARIRLAGGVEGWASVEYLVPKTALVGLPTESP